MFRIRIAILTPNLCSKQNMVVWVRIKPYDQISSLPNTVPTQNIPVILNLSLLNSPQFSYILTYMISTLWPLPTSLYSSYSNVVAALSLQHTPCNTYNPLKKSPLAVEFLFRRHSQHLWHSVSSHLAFRIVYNMDKRLHVNILRQIFNNISDEICCLSHNSPVTFTLW